MLANRLRPTLSQWLLFAGYVDPMLVEDGWPTLKQHWVSDCRRQILTSKVDPRIVGIRMEIFIIAIDP